MKKLFYKDKEISPEEAHKLDPEEKAFLTKRKDKKGKKKNGTR